MSQQQPQQHADTPLQMFNNRSSANKTTILIFYRGERSFFCRQWLRRWLTIPALHRRLDHSDLAVLFVSSQSQGKAYSVAEQILPASQHHLLDSRLFFFGDPQHLLVDHLSTRKLPVPVVTNPESHRAHGWVFDYGMVQPAVVCVAPNEQVVYAWTSKPSILNVAGKLDRPDPWDVWDTIERRLDRIRISMASNINNKDNDNDNDKQLDSSKCTVSQPTTSSEHHLHNSNSVTACTTNNNNNNNNNSNIQHPHHNHNSSSVPIPITVPVPAQVAPLPNAPVRQQSMHNSATRSMSRTRLLDRTHPQLDVQQPRPCSSSSPCALTPAKRIRSLPSNSSAAHLHTLSFVDETYPNPYPNNPYQQQPYRDDQQRHLQLSRTDVQVHDLSARINMLARNLIAEEALHASSSSRVVHNNSNHILPLPSDSSFHTPINNAVTSAQQELEHEHEYPNVSAPVSLTDFDDSFQLPSASHEHDHIIHEIQQKLINDTYNHGNDNENETENRNKNDERRNDMNEMKRIDSTTPFMDADNIRSIVDRYDENAMCSTDKHTLRGGRSISQHDMCVEEEEEEEDDDEENNENENDDLSESEEPHLLLNSSKMDGTDVPSDAVRPTSSSTIMRRLELLERDSVGSDQVDSTNVTSKHSTRTDDSSSQHVHVHAAPFDISASAAANGMNMNVNMNMRRIAEEADDKQTGISDYLNELKDTSLMDSMRRRIDPLREQNQDQEHLEQPQQQESFQQTRDGITTDSEITPVYNGKGKRDSESIVKQATASFSASESASSKERQKKSRGEVNNSYNYKRLEESIKRKTPDAITSPYRHARYLFKQKDKDKDKDKVNEEGVVKKTQQQEKEKKGIATASMQDEYEAYDEYMVCEYEVEEHVEEYDSGGISKVRSRGFTSTTTQPHQQQQPDNNNNVRLLSTSQLQQQQQQQQQLVHHHYHHHHHPSTLAAMASAPAIDSTTRHPHPRPVDNTPRRQPGHVRRVLRRIKMPISIRRSTTHHHPPPPPPPQTNRNIQRCNSASNTADDLHRMAVLADRSRYRDRGETDSDSARVRRRDTLKSVMRKMQPTALHMENSGGVGEDDVATRRSSDTARVGRKDTLRSMLRKIPVPKHRRRASTGETAAQPSQAKPQQPQQHQRQVVPTVATPQEQVDEEEEAEEEEGEEEEEDGEEEEEEEEEGTDERSIDSMLEQRGPESPQLRDDSMLQRTAFDGDAWVATLPDTNPNTNTLNMNILPTISTSSSHSAARIDVDVGASVADGDKLRRSLSIKPVVQVQHGEGKGEGVGEVVPMRTEQRASSMVHDDGRRWRRGNNNHVPTQPPKMSIASTFFSRFRT